MSDRIKGSPVAQDTGNPVLDSTVNVVMACGGVSSFDVLKLIHETLLELAANEPGGLARRGKDGTLIYLSEAE